MKIRAMFFYINILAVTLILSGCFGKNEERTTEKFLKGDDRNYKGKHINIKINPQPGDMVFRRGMPALIGVLKENFTHGAIYLGDGLVLDYWHKGRRISRVKHYYLLASQGDYQCNARLQGQYSDEIIAVLLSNIDKTDIRKSNTYNPPDGFNLLSISDNYKTAVCNEFLHEQYKYAIRILAEKAKKDGDTKKYDALQKEYFDEKGNVKDLAVPTTVVKEMTLLKLKFITRLVSLYGGGKQFEGESAPIPNEKRKRHYSLRCITPDSFLHPNSKFKCIEKIIPTPAPVKPVDKFNRKPAEKKLGTRDKQE